MNRNSILIILVLSLLFSSGSVLTEKVVDKPVDGQIEAKKLDQEARILAAYLAQYNSPMQYHAQDFIDAANEFDLPWNLLPAIAGVESTFGKFIPGGYNAYGWGVYRTQAIYFASWREGIFTVAKGLREGYLNKGLKDPYAINRVYAASPYWGGKVTYFMNDLEKYAQKYQQVQPVELSITYSKTAANSGLLASDKL